MALRVVSKYHFSLKGVRAFWRDGQTQVWEEKVHEESLERLAVWKAGKDQTKIFVRRSQEPIWTSSHWQSWDSVSVSWDNKDMG